MAEKQSQSWENYVAKKQTQGVPKYYKVRAYQTILGTRSYGAFSRVQKAGNEMLPAPLVRFVQTGTWEGQYRHVFNWVSVAGASGYEVYTSTSANGPFTKVAEQDGSWENYVSDEVEGVVKYYKVRAYRLVNGTKQYGGFSEVHRNLPAVEYRFAQAEDGIWENDYRYVLNWIALPDAEGYEV